MLKVFFLPLTLLCQNAYLDVFSYQGIASSPCTRVANAQGPIGCNGGFASSYGPLVQILSDDDLRVFEASGLHGVIAVLALPLLTPEVVLRLEGRLSGIMLVKTMKKGLNPEAKLANWNPNGLDLIPKTFDFPIFMINDLNSTVFGAITLKSALDFNKKAGYASSMLYSMQMEAKMNSGSSNAFACLGRKKCDPIGEKSVWSSASPTIDERSTIFVAAHLDANAFIHDFVMGSSSRASAVVVLAIAEALSNVKILIVLF
jgi:hypothetical protein